MNVSASCSAGDRVSMDVNNNRIEIRFTYLLEADAGVYTCIADLHSSSDPQGTFPKRTAQANINVHSELSDEPASYAHVCVFVSITLCVCIWIRSTSNIFYPAKPLQPMACLPFFAQPH